MIIIFYIYFLIIFTGLYNILANQRKVIKCEYEVTQMQIFFSNNIFRLLFLYLLILIENQPNFK